MTQHEDGTGPETPATATQAAQAAQAAREAARRRFLRVGVGGTAAVVVTMTHKRAFAGGGIKKNVVASNCASLQGVPDLKGVNAKKALATSAMGTPKGLMCLPKPAVNNCVGLTTQASKYYDQNGNQVQVYNLDNGNLKNGCGDLTDTLNYSYKARLYDKGYCPIVYDATGLHYDASQVYYTKQGNSFVSNPCQ